ncbi:hypothetical protein A374_06286 [Fictibacillus macauensis ZFHKF-1]|uniref:N-acetyltransferase domain-containing protein n=1 Tax=Fictibacillus macauensis ZFHKF-1 TaxID=1196324 RepID=I8UH07_9BACL|nr:hypothetical protein A374_06286 [Fictibacillus macauensis ZFHKF-1]
MQRILANDLETILVAQDGERVIGWIVFQSSSRQRLRHTGSFGMMLRKEARNKGIGTLLLQALLEWAEHHPVIEKVCLGVLATNTAAIALYTKLGFQEEGRKINEVKMRSGDYVDDVLMYRFVKNL